MVLLYYEGPQIVVVRVPVGLNQAGRASFLIISRNARLDGKGCLKDCCWNHNWALLCDHMYYITLLLNISIGRCLVVLWRVPLKDGIVIL